MNLTPLFCEMSGLCARPAKCQELTPARRFGGIAILYEGNGVMFGLNGNETMLLEGNIFAAFFQGQRPASVILGFQQKTPEVGKKVDRNKGSPSASSRLRSAGAGN